MKLIVAIAFALVVMVLTFPLNGIAVGLLGLCAFIWVLRR